MSEHNGEAFGVPPAEFDLEAWLSEAQLPTRAVTVVGKAGLIAEHEALQEQLRDVRNHDDDRLGGPRPGVDVAERIVALEDEMNQSRMSVVVRGLTSAERKAVDESTAKGKDGTPDNDDYNARWLAASAVSPKFTVDQAHRFKDRIGEGQYQEVLRAGLALMQQRVTVPTSPAAYSLLSRPASS